MKKIHKGISRVQKIIKKNKITYKSQSRKKLNNKLRFKHAR